MTEARPQHGLWLTFLPPLGVELAETVDGIDWLGVDLQHGELDAGDLPDLLRAASAPVFARVASHDPAVLARVADAGVAGVIVPTVESAEQARALVEAIRLPPSGRRSTGMSRAGLAPGDPPVLLPMVETVAGLHAAEDIARTAHVDGLFIGPYDLSLSLGEDIRSERMVEAMTSIVAAARTHGVLAGGFVDDADLSARLPPLDLVAGGTDAGALRTGLAQLLAPRGS